MGGGGFSFSPSFPVYMVHKKTRKRRKKWKPRVFSINRDLHNYNFVKCRIVIKWKGERERTLINLGSKVSRGLSLLPRFSPYNRFLVFLQLRQHSFFSPIPISTPTLTPLFSSVYKTKRNKVDFIFTLNPWSNKFIFSLSPHKKLQSVGSQSISFFPPYYILLPRPIFHFWMYQSNPCMTV